MSNQNHASPDALSKLGFTPYKGSVPFDELQFPDEQADPDFEWAANDPDLRRLYYGKVVVVKDRKIWGVGNNYRAALDDAQLKKDCPPSGLVCVVIA